MPMNRISGSFANSIVGRTWAVSVTTSSAVVLPAKDGRTVLTFHNPGTVDVYVCQQYDVNDALLTASVNGAGVFQVLAGDYVEIVGPGNGAWLGIAVSPAVLTIFEQ